MSEKWTNDQRVEWSKIHADLERAKVLAHEIHGMIDSKPSFWSRLKVFIFALAGRYP